MGRFIALAALTAMACSKSSSPPPIDGVAVKLTSNGEILSSVTYDDQRRTWFLVRPRWGRESAMPVPTHMCRFDRRELACGAIPEIGANGEVTLGVELIPPANGAVPHLLVEYASGAEIWEPFSWRVVRKFDGVSLSPDELLVWADGSLLAASYRGALLARPGETFRPLPGFPRIEVSTVHVSRWGLVWLERGTTKDDSTLKAAAFDGFALGPTRSYGRHPRWGGVCRDGDTFGYRTVDDKTDGKLARMVDLASGAASETFVSDALWLQCRPGEVGAIAIELRSAPSARCDRSGCRMHFTPPSRQGLNYHQLVLVEGSLMLVSGGLGNDQLVSQRTDAAPRLQRITGGSSFLDLQLVMTTEGALGIYGGGMVVALDHQGTPIPIKVRWVNSPW